MKILVLNGSPKKEKSDTMHITRSFLQGIEETTTTYTQIIHVTEKNIKYCNGCFTCKRNGGICIHNDDMADILKEMINSDILLFNFPLYSYGMPAALKNLIDRTLPLSSMTMKKAGDRYHHIGKVDYSHLKYIMICGCGFPNAEHNFEPAVEQFKLLFPNNNTVITIPESPMFNAEEAKTVTVPRLQLVKEAGREYAKHGKISEKLLTEIQTPMIPHEIYAKIANSEQ